MAEEIAGDPPWVMPRPKDMLGRMRFAQYGPSSLRGCKIDWKAVVVVDDALRQAIHPQDAESFRAGRLRRPLRVEPAPSGRRSKGVRRPPARTHDAGAIVLGNVDDTYFLVEVTDDLAD